jgi:hypothetical protein
MSTERERNAQIFAAFRANDRRCSKGRPVMRVVALTERTT